MPGRRTLLSLGYIVIEVSHADAGLQPSVADCSKVSCLRWINRKRRAGKRLAAVVGGVESAPRLNATIGMSGRICQQPPEPQDGPILAASAANRGLCVRQRQRTATTVSTQRVRRFARAFNVAKSPLISASFLRPAALDWMGEEPFDALRLLRGAPLMRPGHEGWAGRGGKQPSARKSQESDSKK